MQIVMMALLGASQVLTVPLGIISMPYREIWLTTQVLGSPAMSLALPEGNAYKQGL